MVALKSNNRSVVTPVSSVGYEVLWLSVRQAFNQPIHSGSQLPWDTTCTRVFPVLPSVRSLIHIHITYVYMDVSVCASIMDRMEIDDTFLVLVRTLF